MSTASVTDQPPLLQIGRYTLLHELAAGGMGTVHLAKFHGEAGFSRLLAVKRLHPHYAKDPDFLCMFLDEARIASRIRHPHVVSVVDVVSYSGELLLAMEYVQGLALSKVLRLVQPAGVPPNVAVAIAGGILQGLHAAHEAKTDRGEPLGLVHRDVSPQNVMLGADGVARVVDFGIATAAARLQTTAEGQVKGKLSYMSPEQVGSRPLDRRADIFATGVVLWEMLTGQRFCEGDVAEKVRYISTGKFKKPSEIRPELPFALDEIVMKAITKIPSERYATAEEMMGALFAARRPAHAHEVREWLSKTAGSLLEDLARTAEAAEALQLVAPPPTSHPSSASGTPADLRLEVPAAFDEATEATAVERQKQEESRRSWVLATLGAVAVLLLLGGGIITFTGSLDPPPTGSVTSGPASETAASLPEEVPAEASPEPSAPEPEKSAVPEEEKAPPTGDAPEAAPAKSPKAASGARISPRPRRDPCSPPYVLLKGGLKRYKPECL